MHETELWVPSPGKWNKHVDAWDSITDNEFFSFEGAAFVLKQMFQVAKPPNRFTPEYAIMKKFKDWEIRRRARLRGLDCCNPLWRAAALAALIDIWEVARPPSVVCLRSMHACQPCSVPYDRTETSKHFQAVLWQPWSQPVCEGYVRSFAVRNFMQGHTLEWTWTASHPWSKWSWSLHTKPLLLCLRSYKPFVAAQVAGRPDDEAEALLRAYLGGANARRQRLDLTTPLWRDSEGAVSFSLPGVQACAGLGTRSVLCKPSGDC